MKILVQKFGGTSVSTPDRRRLVVDKIMKARSNGYNVVVVVSAMGREGSPYATDTLLSLVQDSFKENNKLATDLLMCCGEIISSIVLCEELSKFNIKALPLTGGQAGIITNDNFGEAAVRKVESDTIKELLSKDIVPVVTGFQGVTEKGCFTTLGRGGSDVTAVLLGASLKSEEVEIYTDVDGIMTADPRIVEDAVLIKNISYNEVFQLADQGAKVIHPRAVEIAMNSNMALIIKNTLNECEGTLINSGSSENTQSIITGITQMDNRLQIKVSFEENEENPYYSTLLNKLAEKGISIDLINVFPYEQVFTVDIKDKSSVDMIMKQLEIKYKCIDACCKIAIIGVGMRGIPGVMARILKSLYSEGIEIYQTADSHMTIWCLVKSELAKRAVKVLHKEFNLGN